MIYPRTYIYYRLDSPDMAHPEKHHNISAFSSPYRSPPVLSARRWLARDKQIVYVFVGPLPKEVMTVLRRVEEGGVQQSRAVTSDPKSVAILRKHFSLRDMKRLMLPFPKGSPISAVRYVEAVLYPDDSIKTLKHKLISATLGGSEQQQQLGDAHGSDVYMYDRMYIWTQNQVGDRASRDLVRAFVKNTFRGRLTCSKNELLRDLARLREGYYHPQKEEHADGNSSSTKQYVTVEHAVKMVQQLGGIRTRTSPVTFSLESAGFPILFDHHPYAAPVVADMDIVSRDGTPKNVYLSQHHDNLLLDDFVPVSQSSLVASGSQTHKQAEAPDRNGRESRGDACESIENVAFDFTMLPDLERHVQKASAKGEGEASLLRHGFLTRYFPAVRTDSLHTARRAMGLGSEQVHADLMAEYRDILHWESKHLNTLQNASVAITRKHQPQYSSAILVHVNVRTSSSSSSAPRVLGQSSSSFDEGMDLNAVFNAFDSSTDVPFIKFYDGSTHIYKVSRMALHKQIVDVPLVARWIASPRGGRQGNQPYVQFVTRTDGGKFCYTKLLNSGRMDTNISYQVSTPGTEEDLAASLSTVNKHVIAPFNSLGMYPEIKMLDEYVLRTSSLMPQGCGGNELATELVNVETVFTVPSPLRSSPSPAQIAVALSRLPHMSLVMPPSQESGGAVTAYYKRTNSHDSKMNWLNHVRILRDDMGLPRDDIVDRLARTFFVSRTYASQYLENVERGVFANERYKLMSWHHKPDISSITVVPMGQTGFRVLTNGIRRPDHVTKSITLTAASIADAADVSLPQGSGQRAREAVLQELFGKHTEMDTKKMKSATIRPEITDTQNMSSSDTGDVEAAAALGSFFGEDPEKVEEMAYAPNDTDDVLEELLREQDTSTDNLVPPSADPGDDIAVGDIPEATSPVPQGRPSPGIGMASAEKKARNDQVLQALHRADRELFNNKSGDNPAGSKAGYAGICGAVNARQPVVVSAEELKAIDEKMPGSYDGAIAYGSTPELASRNRYICPKVWCPKSRVSMTAEQFEAHGRKCPFPDVQEEPVVFENSYWDGKPRYPGFLTGSHHPKGFCMPCCFIKKFQKFDKCGVPRMDHHPPHTSSGPVDRNTNGDTNRSSSALLGPDVDEEDEAVLNGKRDAVDKTYIKSETSLPLEEGRFGMLPGALLSAFHGFSPSGQPGAGFDGKVMRCGSRDNGSGQFTPQTDCYVRMGVPRDKQSFLNCMMQVIGPDLPREVSRAGIPGLVEHVCSNISPLVYVQMNRGYVCRMFMGNRSEASQSEDTRFGTFASWFGSRTDPSARAYHDAMQLHDVASMVRNGNTDDPQVVREHLIFQSLQRFKRYMRDQDVVKSHTVLLGLFNMPLSWLNPRGINIVVFDRVMSSSNVSLGLPDLAKMADATQQQEQQEQAGKGGGMERSFGVGDVLVDCDSVRRDGNAFRMSDPFALIVKQGPFYEPVHHVRAQRSGQFEHRKLFLYRDSNKHGRALLEMVVRGCKAKEPGYTMDLSGRLCTSAACMVRYLTQALGERVVAQVIDYTFQLVGLVTERELYVPLFRRETMLVGQESPPHTVYIGSTVTLRPRLADTSGHRHQKRSGKHTSVHTELAAFFNTLAELTGDDRYSVSHATEYGDSTKVKTKSGGPAALVLRSGNVVPLDLRADDPVAQGYLENLNIMVGRSLPDARWTYWQNIEAKLHQDVSLKRGISAKLQENTSMLNEFMFLRRALNPFPYWYRRRRMRALLVQLGIGTNGRLVDDMLFGPDIFGTVSSRSVRGRRARPSGSHLNSRPVIITDADVVRGDGAWLARLQQVAANPLSSENEAELQGIALSAEVRNANKEIARRLRDIMLRASLMCSPGDSSSSLSIPSLYTARGRNRLPSTYAVRKALSIRRKNKEIPQLVKSCSVWHVFHAASMLTSASGQGIPLAGIRSVIKNSIFRFFAANNNAATSMKDDTYQAFELLLTHPSLGKHGRGLKKGKVDVDTARDMARQVDQLTYKAGLYDAWVLCHFCSLACYVLPGGEDAMGAFHPLTDLSSSRPLFVWNTDDEKVSYAVVFTHEKGTGSVDLITNGDFMMFPSDSHMLPRNIKRTKSKAPATRT